MGELDPQLLRTALRVQGMDDAAFGGLLAAEGLPADTARDDYVASMVQRVMVRSEPPLASELLTSRLYLGACSVCVIRWMRSGGRWTPFARASAARSANRDSKSARLIDPWPQFFAFD